MAASLPPAKDIYQSAHIPQSTSTSIIAVNVVLPAIATVFVVLRMIASKTTRTSWQASDLVMIAALLITYILCSELILCAHFGMDHHLLYTLEVHPTDLTRVLKMQFSIDITWTICTYLVKLSNILLLARIFARPVHPRFRLCLHLLHAFLLLWTTAAFFSVIFRCTPVQSFWDANVKSICLHAQAGRIATAALNTLTNVLLLILPIQPVLQLHLPVMQKLAVVGMFGVGTFCLAASVVRLDYSVAAHRYHNHDPTYMNAAPLVWASVEPCVGIVCACLPLMRPLFVNVRVRTLRRWFSGSIFITKEADTWWYPPSDEFEKEDNITGHIECATKGADPDRNFLSVDRHKAEVKKGVVTVTEVGEGEPSMDITTWMYDK